MEKLMNKYNLKYEFIEAVDGNQLSKEELKKYSSSWWSFFYNGYSLTAGELGVSLSHLKCWKRMQKERVERVMIVEDDILFNEKLTEFLFRADDFPKDWEFINLTTLANYLFYTHERLFDLYSFVKFSEPDPSCCAYIVNLKAVDKLISSFCFPMTNTIDGGITGDDLYTGVISYGVHPHIVTLERKFNTSIPHRVHKNTILYFFWHIFVRGIVLKIRKKWKIKRLHSKIARELQALQSKT